MSDVEAVRKDIAKMIDLGAPESDIDAYVAAHGLTVNDFAVPQVPQEITDREIGNDIKALGRGAVIGLGKLGTGIIQTGAEKVGYKPLIESTGRVAANLQNASNENKAQYPISGTVGELAPQIGSVAGLGVSLPAIAAGSGALAYLSPHANPELVAPSNGTALERAMQPIGSGASKLVEYMGMNPETRLAQGTAGAMLGAASYGAGKGVSKLAEIGNKGAKAAVRGATKVNPEAIAALEQSGIEPTLQLATDSNVMRSLGNSMRNMPLLGNRLEANTSGAINQLESNVGAAANKLGTASDAIEGGAALQRGLRTYKDQTGATIEGLYNKVDETIPPSTPANLTNTRQFAEGYINKYPDAPNIGASLTDPRVQSLSEGVISDANPSYGTLKNLRTDIGEQAGKMDAPSAYKQMYGAATRDMQATAQGVSPEAAQAASRANNYYRAVTQRNEKLARFFDQNKDGTFVMSPEKATQATRTELQLLKKSIPKADFDDYTSSVIRKLGEAPAGAQNATGDVFSPNTFLTNYSKLRQSGKADVLFNKDIAIELNRAAKVADRFRQIGKTANTSNTTNSAIAAGSMWGLVTRPLKTATLGIPAYGFERLLTSPKALKVINDYAYKPVLKNAAIRGEFSTRLFQAAGQDADLRRDVEVYIESMPNITDSKKVILKDKDGVER